MNEKAAWQEQLNWSKTSDFYKRLNCRRFSKLPGYGQFDQATMAIATILRSGQFASWSHIKRDIGFCIALETFSDLLGHAQEFPVLALDRALFQALNQTYVPPDITMMRRVFPVGLLLLPQKTIQTPEGDWIDWLVFRHGLAGDILPPIKTVDDLIADVRVDRDSIAWAAQPSGITWASNEPLQFKDKAWTFSDEMVSVSLGTALSVTQDDQTVIERVSMLVANVLLYLQFRPEEATEPAVSSVASGSGFGKSSDRNRIFTPRIIGKQHHRPTSEVSRSSPSYRSSPHTHWRRGHWRRVAMGEGRQQRQWRWIEPVLVNANSLSS